jgi:ABC-type uncharacterized transport system involved in gliding motility auxiliary subunit
MKKYLIYCLLLGIILTTAGIIAEKISGIWSPLAIGLSLGGSLILVIWLGLFLSYNKTFWQLRSTEAGTNALISTLAVIVILVLVNFLALRYPFKIDFTETKLFTLSPQSQEIVANLSQPLKVYIFEKSPNSQDQDLLENYRRQNPKNFSFEFVDPQLKIALAEKFKVKLFGEVHLEYNNKNSLVQTLNPETRLSEVKLTNGIAAIQRDKQPLVYILQGHGEPTLSQQEGSLSQAVTTLTEKGYLVEELNLAVTPLIPPTADAVIITTPQRKLLAGEITILQQYLDQGGNLLVMLNARQESGLQALLKDWGIILDQRVVVDGSGKGQVFGFGSLTTFVLDYGAHPITENFSNGISLFPEARAIMTQSVGGVETFPLLISNNQSWGESDLQSEAVELNLNEDIPGPLDIGVALVRKESGNQGNQSNLNTEKTGTNQETTTTDITENNSNAEAKTEENQQENNSTLPTPPEIKNPEENPTEQQTEQAIKPEAKMVVIGNSTFATDGWFEQQLNGDVFLNSVEWLANDDVKMLSISSKEPKNRRLNISTIESEILSWLALLIIPVGGFISAIVVWRKRQ